MQNNSDERLIDEIQEDEISNENEILDYSKHKITIISDRSDSFR